MSLTTIELIMGIFNFMVMLVYVIVGLRIASKYIKYRQKTLIYAGVAWSSIGTVFLGFSINFIYYLFTGKLVSEVLVWILTSCFVPVGLTFIYFLLADLKVNIQGFKRLIQLYSIITNIIFEIYLIYAYITDISLVGISIGAFDGVWQGISALWLLYAMISVVIIVLIIGIDAIKSTNAEVKLKGKFLIIAVVVFLLASILDLNYLRLTDNPYIAGLAKLFMIISGLLFYCGYILPIWIKNLFIEKE